MDDTLARSEIVSISSDVESAGTLLVDIASKDWHSGRRRIFEEEKLMLNECLERGYGVPGFKKFHIDAIHQAAKFSNLEVAELLLSQDPSLDLLCDDRDILQFALRKEDPVAYRKDDELLHQMMSLVISHGAPVNAIASNGNTALSLTCDYGFARAFHFLVQSGADYSTLHRSEAVKRTDSESNSTPADAASELNLLQVALNARLRDERYGTANSEYGQSYAETWGPIIQYLCGAGLRTARNDASLVKFLHVACYQGQKDYVELILRHGVDIHAKAARVDDRDTVYGSALHAAAAGGHKDIVLQLLGYGADPRKARLQEYMKSYSRIPDEVITPIAAALKSPEYRSSVISQKVLDACEAIYEAGASEADRKLLVVACAKNGNVEMLNRLLQSGRAVDRIPLCSSIEAVTFLLDRGTAIDAKEFQQYAVEEGLLDLFKFLVDKFGPLLTMAEEVSDIVLKSLQRDRSTIVTEYLIRDYGHSASAGRSLHGNVATELFRRFCNSLQFEQLRSILQDAARSGCPGVHRGALSTLATELHRRRFDPYKVYGNMTKERVCMYQLLLRFSEGTESQKDEDGSKLWLTPGNLPQYVWDCVNSMPTSEAEKSEPRTFSENSVSVQSSESSVKQSALQDDDDENEAAPQSRGNSLDNVATTPTNDGYVAHNNDIALLPPHESNIGCGDNTNQTDQADIDRLSFDSKNDKEPRRDSVSRTAATSDSTSFLTPPPSSEAALCAKKYRFEYDQLNGSFAIRLMSIEPSTDREAPLRCHLITTNLGLHPEYEALSYVWGELPETVEIALNEFAFVITKNLWSALRRLRYPDKERTLWVDAICINQDLVPERNQQVRIMREIYESAQRTLMWVGEEANDSHLIFEHINNWKTYRDDYNAGRTKKNNPWGEAHINMPQYRGDIRKAFDKFCLRPYFYRSWVIQEVAVSKQALVTCGQDQEEFKLFIRGAGFKMGNLYGPFQGVDAVTHVHDLQQLSRNSNLKSILQYSRFCGATDARDKVFGLLGLFAKPLIAVDYALDVQTVFREFTEAIIRDQQNIEFLHWFGISERHVHGLPSWVPDYTASKPTGVLPRVYHHTHIVTAASGSLRKALPGIQIDGSRLRIKGSYLDTILHISCALSPHPENHLDGDSFGGIMHNWEETAATLCAHKRYATPIAEVFLKTLTGGQSASMLWYSNFGSGTLKSLEQDYFNDYDVLRAWRSEGDARDGHEANTMNHFKNRLKDCCYGRRLFVTEKGSMGLAPSAAHEGDLIAFFSGGLYPFILRPLGDDTFSIMGDCYLYEPGQHSSGNDDFNEHVFYRDDIYRDVTEWVIR